MPLEKVVGNFKKIKNSFFVLKNHDIQKLKLRLFENTQFFTWIMTLEFFLPNLHQWNFSVVVAHLPSISEFPGSRPGETTFYFSFT